MRILVTGTAGFIGFHLAKALLNDGHEVVGYDNFNDYYSVRLKRDRHAILEKCPGYCGTEADLCDRETLQGLFRQRKIERVCHLAAQAGVRYSLKNPFAYQHSNLEGFLNVLEVSRQNRVNRLVYASSSSVYGGNMRLPFSELDPVDTPISLYAATKKSNELMAHAYSHLYGLQAIGLRFFTVYGPWGRPDMAVWIFAKAIVEGRPIQVFNHGRMRRDFTYVDDVLAGVKGALFADNLSKYEIFNLGNHRSEELLDMISILGQAIGAEPSLEMAEMQDGDIPETFADIEKARSKLGFAPQTTIREGIPRFVDWFCEYHHIAR